ncbi:MFS transporter [Pseudooceanicola sp. LIPI14-2-Ac024]|uniref:MFS transporter n=1 Tax=Pseudooceanicola sp. LIPI14-2-Ac024 TaxID=3344875 RepID=UPI0035CEED3C
MPADPASVPRWRVISALGVVQILAWGSSYYLIAVISAPIQAETGWSAGLVTGGISIGLLCSGLSAVVVGRLIEAFGGRKIMATGMALLASGLVLMSLAQAPVLYLAAWAVMGMGMAASLYDAAFATLGRIYGADARSAITALTLWGGFASTICWPLSAFLVEQIGWRGTCLTYAGLHLFVTAPICLFGLPRGKPRPKPEAGDAPRDASVLRDYRFWLIALAMTMTAGIAAFWSVHLISIMTAEGLSLAAAVALGTVIGPAQVGARLFEMAGRGRHHPTWTGVTYSVCGVAGFAMLWLGWPATLAFIAYGAGNGLWSIARGSMPLAIFGVDRYARTVGMLAMPVFAASAVFPLAGAAAIDRFGTAWAVPGSLLLALIPFGAALILLRDHLRGRATPVR